MGKGKGLSPEAWSALFGLLGTLGQTIVQGVMAGEHDKIKSVNDVFEKALGSDGTWRSRLALLEGEAQANAMFGGDNGD